MALLIGWQLLKIFDRVADGEHWIGQTLVPWHVSIGTLLLLLIALRTVWAVRQKGSRPEQDPATAFLVRIGHSLLYVGMALMPIIPEERRVGKEWVSTGSSRWWPFR